MIANTRPSLTVAICTYNRCDRLPTLVRALREQTCQAAAEILFVDNNSSDATQQILEDHAGEAGMPLRVVTETTQGIPHARNRAIEECLDRDFMLFMDDDELPAPGLLQAAVEALQPNNADCAGGQVEVQFPPSGRPDWLTDELLGFLAAVNHGAEPFRIQSTATPIWTANVAYRMGMFRSEPDLRFDLRYTRIGHGIGGGEDAIMFRELLKRGKRVWYAPAMKVLHDVDAWRLHRRYFLQLHHAAGVKKGRFAYTPPAGAKALAGIPLYLLPMFAQQVARTLGLYARGNDDALRQAMNVAHTLGLVRGLLSRSTNLGETT